MQIWLLLNFNISVFRLYKIQRKENWTVNSHTLIFSLVQVKICVKVDEMKLKVDAMKFWNWYGDLLSFTTDTVFQPLITSYVVHLRLGN